MRLKTILDQNDDDDRIDTSFSVWLSRFNTILSMLKILQNLIIKEDP